MSSSLLQGLHLPGRNHLWHCKGTLMHPLRRGVWGMGEPLPPMHLVHLAWLCSLPKPRCMAGGQYLLLSSCPQWGSWVWNMYLGNQPLLHNFAKYSQRINPSCLLRGQPGEEIRDLLVPGDWNGQKPSEIFSGGDLVWGHTNHCYQSTPLPGIIISVSPQDSALSHQHRVFH